MWPQNRGSGPPWGLPCVLPCVRTETPGPSLSPHGGPFGSLDSTVPAPPPARENRETCSHPPCAPTPIKEFHGGCFLPAFEEKTLCLSFLSSARLGISVSGDRKWLQASKRSCLSLALAQSQRSQQEAPSGIWNFLTCWENCPLSLGPLRVRGLTWALLTPGVPNRVQACGAGSLEAQACLLAQGLSLDLWVTLGTSWSGGVLTRKAQCQSPAACFTLEPVM